MERQLLPCSGQRDRLCALCLPRSRSGPALGRWVRALQMSKRSLGGCWQGGQRQPGLPSSERLCGATPALLLCSCG